MTLFKIIVVSIYLFLCVCVCACVCVFLCVYIIHVQKNCLYKKWNITKRYLNSKWVAGPAKLLFISIIIKLGYNKIYITKTGIILNNLAVRGRKSVYKLRWLWRKSEFEIFLCCVFCCLPNGCWGNCNHQNDRCVYLFDWVHIFTEKT